jgi:hypothetical protein
MSVSRRKFLRAGTMIALSATLPLSLATFAAGQKQRKDVSKIPDQLSSLPAASQKNPLFYFTRQTFVPYVNSIFKVNSELLAEIVLIEVKETPLVVDKRSTRIPTGENFTLTFRGPNRTRFEQNTYTVEHAALGKFELFLVPTGLPSSEQLYVAVINRRQ